MNKLSKTISKKSKLVEEIDLKSILNEMKIDLSERIPDHVPDKIMIGGNDILSLIKLNNENKIKNQKDFVNRTNELAKHQKEMSDIGIIVLPLSEWDKIQSEYFENTKEQKELSNHLKDIPDIEKERVYKAGSLNFFHEIEMFVTKKKVVVTDPIIGYRDKILSMFFLIAMWGDEADVMKKILRKKKKLNE